METHTTAALIASGCYIKVTTGDDDQLVRYFPAEQFEDAFAAAATRSADRPFTVKAVEVDPGGRTVSTFIDGVATSVESF